MQPLGIASAALDVLNVPADAGRQHVHPVPSAGRAGRVLRVPETAVASHALHAATCALPVLGDEAFVLARVLYQGTELELRIMCVDDVPPVSMSFQAPLLANVGVFEDPTTSTIHVLCVSSVGFVYRLTIPIAAIVRNHPLPSRWVQEQPVDILQADDAPEATLVYAIDAGLLLVACADGTLVRLEQENMGDGSYARTWRESSMRPSSFLSGVSRLFHRNTASPSASAKRAPSPTQTLSVATHVRENDAALAFCVCRDRKLRIWNMVSETCIRTLSLPSSYTAAANNVSAAEEEMEGDAFERSPPLVQLFYPSEAGAAYALYLLLFIPAPLPGGAFVVAYGVELEESSSWSGGVGEIALVWGKACDARTHAADVELRDMALSVDQGVWHIWLLWHAGGAPLLQHTLALQEDDGRGGQEITRRGARPQEAWSTTGAYAQYAPLRGPDFDAALAALHGVQDTAQFFLERLLVPARFSSTTLAAALRVYTGETQDLARMQQRTRLAEAICTIVAGHAVPPADASAQSPSFTEQARAQWLRFSRIVEQIDRNAHWPLRLCMLPVSPTPLILARHTLEAVVEKDAGAWVYELSLTLARAAQHPERPMSRALGEAASSEFAATVNAMALDAAYAEHTSEPYTLVRHGGASLLQWSTLCAEVYVALGARMHAMFASIVRDAVCAEDGATLIAAAIAPEHAADMMRAYIGNVGGEALVQHAQTSLHLLFAPLRCSAPQCDALLRMLGAEAAASMLRARCAGLEALIAALALVLRHAQHPGLQDILTQALRAWQHATALYTLSAQSALPETIAFSVDAIPFSHLRLTASAPAVHLLAFLAQVRAGTCTLARRACFNVCLDMGELPLGRGTAAPLAILHLARVLLANQFPSAARRILALYTPDAAAVYLTAVADTCLARCAAALHGFVCAAAVLGHDSDARTRLLAVLPQKMDLFAFWMHAASHLDAAGDVHSALQCFEHARTALHDHVSKLDAQELWSRLFGAALALGAYERAATIVMQIPLEALGQVCLQRLVTALCEADVGLLLQLHFGALQPQVERTLSFHARNAEPRAEPNYFHVLYAYHTSRGDYKSAAASMYQYARRLRYAAFAACEKDTPRVAVEQAQSYLAAINALALLPAAQAWFAHALTDELTDGAAPASMPVASAKALTGRLTSFIPSSAKALSLAIVQLADVRREYNELLARLELMRLYPALAHPAAALRAEDAVNLFLAADNFDAAFCTAHALAVDMRNAFDALVQRCVALTRADARRKERLQFEECDTSPDTALQRLVLEDEEGADMEAAFLRRSPRAASWTGRVHARAWKFLRLQLSLVEHAAHAATYRAAIADRLVALDAWSIAPPWLHDWFREHAPDVFLRIQMRHGRLLDALTYAQALVQASQSAARTGEVPRAPGLPYTLFDSLLAASTTQDTRAAAQALRAALDARLGAVQQCQDRAQC
ncbi:hypothetical protein MVES1_000774 [Malassezia vespertilionis]|nr:uncharacterized protein MVES1_000774 [Malassezia vespertilionis]WFD05444.1 hypothetical protein MVES1_000774 [Malassezia vespertilionis]